jgi:hypothetical protein
VIEDFLSKHLEQVMTVPKREKDAKAESEAEKLFESFSYGFMDIYKTYKKENESINTGKSRKCWRCRAINSHLKKLCDSYHITPFYELKRQPDGDRDYILTLSEEGALESEG